MSDSIDSRQRGDSPPSPEKYTTDAPHQPEPVKYQADAMRLVDALNVRSWAFHRVEAALDWVYAIEIALFEAREDEFVNAELRVLTESPTDPFDDDDIPF
jgi:hypothetical protein